MIIVFVAFNIKAEKAVKYQKYKTKQGAMKAFEECLDREDIDFFSIRKVSA